MLKITEFQWNRLQSIAEERFQQLVEVYVRDELDRAEVKPSERPAHVFSLVADARAHGLTWESTIADFVALRLRERCPGGVQLEFPEGPRASADARFADHVRTRLDDR